MNLLNYKNRFRDDNITVRTANELNGYLWALDDILDYLHKKSPSHKQMYDSIKETLDELDKVREEILITMKLELDDFYKNRINLGGDKATQFLKDQLPPKENDNDDIKDLFNHD